MLPALTSWSLGLSPARAGGIWKNAWIVRVGSSIEQIAVGDFIRLDLHDDGDKTLIDHVPHGRQVRWPYGGSDVLRGIAAGSAGARRWRVRKRPTHRGRVGDRRTP
jgi:hypothetical protein